MPYSKHQAVLIAVILTGVLTRPTIAQDDRPVPVDTPALAKPAEVPDRVQNQDTDPAFRSPLRSKTLKYADALSAADALSKLFSLNFVAAEASSNTVFYRADDAMLDEIRSFFAELEGIASEEKAKKDAAASVNAESEDVRDDVLRVHMFSLQKKIAENVAKLENLKQHVGPQHPSIKPLQAEVDKLQELLARHKKPLRERQASMLLEALIPGDESAKHVALIRKNAEQLRKDLATTHKMIANAEPQEMEQLEQRLQRLQSLSDSFEETLQSQAVVLVGNGAFETFSYDLPGIDGANLLAQLKPFHELAGGNTTWEPEVGRLTVVVPARAVPAMRDIIRQLTESDRPRNADPVSVMESSILSRMRILSRKLAEKDIKLAGLSSGLGPQHPARAGLQKERDTLAEMLAAADQSLRTLQRTLVVAEDSLRTWNNEAKGSVDNQELQPPFNRASRYQLLPWMPGVERAEKFQQLEDRSRALAKELQQHGADSDEADELEPKLRKIVEQAFDARQKLQSAHAETLRAQLQAIESRIQRREELKEKIVERRIEELMNGSEIEAWDSSISPEPIMLPN